MTTKLDWNYDDKLGCEVAFHNGYRIRAERDDNASNPFEEWDGNWPIMVYSDRNITVYEKTGGPDIRSVLNRFTDEQIVFSQKAIASAFDTTIQTLLDDYSCQQYPDDETPTPNWCWDADTLRDAFQGALCNTSDSDLIDTLAGLYDLLDIPTLTYQSRGYCQGDWAELLIVATPEAATEFGTASNRAGGPGHHAHVDAYWENNLTSTGDLYSAWAWGDVYGYIIEENVNAEEPAACNQCGNTLNDGSDICDQCGGEFEDPEPEWEEIEDGSCWGFYGNDHAESGLEEAALECVPDEPARLPDAELEDA